MAGILAASLAGFTGVSGVDAARQALAEPLPASPSSEEAAAGRAGAEAEGLPDDAAPTAGGSDEAAMRGDGASASRPDAETGEGGPSDGSDGMGGSAADGLADDPLAADADGDLSREGDARAAEPTLYVAATGSDAAGDGSQKRPFATIAAAVARADASAPTVVAVTGDLVVSSTAQVGAKRITVRGVMAGAAPPVAKAASATMFAVGTGSLTLESLVIDGASAFADHRVAAAAGAGASVTLGAGATVRNWFSSGAAGAFSVRGNGASFTMKSGSRIEGCRLAASASGSGGAAVNIAAARSVGAGTAPSSASRASLSMEGGAAIVDCDVRMTANAELSGGGAIHAADTDLAIRAGASISGCDVEYRDASGALFDATPMRQGGGGIHAANCKLTLAGTLSDCHMASAENTGVGNFFAGGGGAFVYNYGCTPSAAVDCRTSIEGSVTDCSAIAGGGIFYWSEADGYDQGDNFWIGSSGPLTSAKDVVARVWDACTLSGTIARCSTTDANSRRAANLSAYVDFEMYGIGGGAICGALTGLVVLADGARIFDCSTGSEGGAVSSWGTSVFCLDGSSDGSGGPVVERCSARGIAGGISAGASSHIENVTVRDCTAGQLGGGLYVYSGSTTLYNCTVTGCSAGLYGGGIMQHVVHDLFMYGGRIVGNHAGSGGGGMVLAGHSDSWSAAAPRGLSLNYPASLNGGYTNPAYYKTAILASKIGAPSVVAGNTEGAANAISNVWTPAASPATRISVAGPFSAGSKIGVSVAAKAPGSNKAGSQFGSVSQTGLALGPFSCDADQTLAAAYSGGNLVWTPGFTVTYKANIPSDAQQIGEVPFDGVEGIPHAYARSGAGTTALAAGTLAADGYAFTGWSVGAAGAVTHKPGSSIAYSAALDPGKNGRITMYATWKQVAHVCQIIRDADGDGAPEAFHKAYASLHAAFADARSGDRIELLVDAPLVAFGIEGASRPADGRVVLAAGVSGVVLTTAPAVQPVAGALPWQGTPASSGSPAAVVLRTQEGAVTASLAVEGGLTLRGIVLDGACTPDQAAAGAGIRGRSALVRVSGAQASLALGSGAQLRNANASGASGGALAVASGASASMEAGARIADSSARDGGGIAVSSGSLALAGGVIEGCRADRLGGGVQVGPDASVRMGAGFIVRKNVAGGSGGGLYVDAAGHLALEGGIVSENACSASYAGSDAPAGAATGGVGHGPFAGGVPLVTLSGDAVVSGNTAKALSGTAASNAEAAATGGSWSLAVAVSGLGASASVGVTSANASLLASGARFATVAGGSAAGAANLGAFSNDADGSLVGAAGSGAAVVWRPSRVAVSFTKVGADQGTGLYAGRAGAVFHLYRYVGEVPLSAAAMAGGAVELASPSSRQWAAVTGPDGSEAAPGDASAVPYGFVSSDGSDGKAVGEVELAGVSPGAWYMLAEEDAPQGFQRPMGQWAFRVAETEQGSGVYGIDAGALLARRGLDGSLPPAFATSLEMEAGLRRGLFLPNTPLFPLPFAGGAPWEVLLAAAGAALALAGAGLLHCRRRR